ncbi:PE-PPE domain-containing protein [Mycobacterium sp. smrl_JER01]|uniref:PE-PPE domain-containing protein n=1 Tax=Mycobacterium sp. smrl_JER01 TaxID=3402633 RepID=UPI003AC42247
MESGTVSKPRAVIAQAGVAAVAASLSLFGTPAAQAQAANAEVADAQVVLPGPATVLSLGLVSGSVHDDLQGVVCASPNTCQAVKYPRFFYPSGADPLDAAIRQTDGLKIVYGYSQGGQVISAWMRKYAAEADAPPADELVFVIIGNGDRPRGGSNAASGFATPETQYKVIDVARQYDFAADFPDNPFNLLALANAMAGFSSVHTDYEDVDLYDPNNIVWVEGNTTYVFVPTEKLPLLNPLRFLGMHRLADQLNGPLKEIIERAYNRDYLPRPITPPAPPVETAALVEQADGDAEDAVDPEPVSDQAAGSAPASADAAGAEPAGVAPLEDSDHPGSGTDDGVVDDGTDDDGDELTDGGSDELTDDGDELTDGGSDELTDDGDELTDDGDELTDSGDTEDGAGESDSDDGRVTSGDSDNTDSDNTDSGDTNSGGAGSGDD